jgi:hypothetical protein
MNINYPSNWKIIKKLGFGDLKALFRDSQGMKIAKTGHGKESSLYHLMIDLSENPEKPKMAKKKHKGKP